MVSFPFVAALSFVVSAAAALATYEGLVRRFLPGEAGHPTFTSRVRRHMPGEAGRRASSATKGRIEGVKRMLVRLAGRVGRIMPLAHADSDEYRETLERAGVRMEPETWQGVRILSTLGCLVVAAALALPGSGPVPLRLGMTALGGVAGWAVPAALLAVGTKRRREALELQLPDAMELLGIAVAAGSPIEQCFREVAEALEPPFSEEFLMVDREVNLLGTSREEALDKLVRRCGSQQVAAFAAQLSQAINQGSSIAEGLASQAAMARDTAQAAVLERIRKMPTKLDIVLSFCFLPPTVALVIVPTVVELLAFLNDTL